MLDYEILKLIWAVLIMVLFVAFAVTDGFTMGSSASLFFFKNNDHRRVIINTFGPHWDGNQVWFITAIAATFAAWPVFYATAFSTLYLPLFLVLATLFLRATGYEYRNKVDNPKWRLYWDIGILFSGVVPPLILGIGAGNVFLGLPFSFDEMMRPYNNTQLFGLLTPFPLMCGIIAVSMFIMHGNTWLQMKSDISMTHMHEKIATYAAGIVMILFALGGIWVYFGISGYGLDKIDNISLNMVPFSADKAVSIAPQNWFHNYTRYSWMLLAPTLAFLGLLGVILFSQLKKHVFAFSSSVLALTSIIATFCFSIFPFVLTSSIEPNYSLTIWDVASSQKTLMILLYIVIIFLPLILGYTFWSYKKLWGKIRMEDLKDKNRYTTY